METSPRDGPYLRSADAVSSKSYLPHNLTYHIEASSSSLGKQVKTKVIIKKEPVPRQWSPSQLRLKRYPPNSSMMAASKLSPDNTMVVPRELTPITRLQQAVIDA